MISPEYTVGYMAPEQQLLPMTYGAKNTIFLSAVPPTAGKKDKKKPAVEPTLHLYDRQLTSPEQIKVGTPALVDVVSTQQMSHVKKYSTEGRLKQLVCQDNLPTYFTIGQFRYSEINPYLKNQNDKNQEEEEVEAQAETDDIASGTFSLRGTLFGGLQQHINSNRSSSDAMQRTTLGQLTFHPALSSAELASKIAKQMWYTPNGPQKHQCVLTVNFSFGTNSNAEIAVDTDTKKCVRKSVAWLKSDVKGMPLMRANANLSLVAFVPTPQRFTRKPLEISDSLWEDLDKLVAELLNRRDASDEMEAPIKMPDVIRACGLAFDKYGATGQVAITATHRNTILLQPSDGDKTTDTREREVVPKQLHHVFLSSVKPEASYTSVLGILNTIDPHKSNVAAMNAANVNALPAKLAEIAPCKLSDAPGAAVDDIVRAHVLPNIMDTSLSITMSMRNKFNPSSMLSLTLGAHATKRSSKLMIKLQHHRSPHAATHAENGTCVNPPTGEYDFSVPLPLPDELPEDPFDLLQDGRDSLIAESNADTTTRTEQTYAISCTIEHTAFKLGHILDADEFKSILERVRSSRMSFGDRSDLPPRVTSLCMYTTTVFPIAKSLLEVAELPATRDGKWLVSSTSRTGPIRRNFTAHNAIGSMKIVNADLEEALRERDVVRIMEETQLTAKFFTGIEKMKRVGGAKMVVNVNDAHTVKQPKAKVEKVEKAETVHTTASEKPKNRKELAIDVASNFATSPKASSLILEDPVIKAAVAAVETNPLHFPQLSLKMKSDKVEVSAAFEQLLNMKQTSTSLSRDGEMIGKVVVDVVSEKEHSEPQASQCSIELALEVLKSVDGTLSISPTMSTVFTKSEFPDEGRSSDTGLDSLAALESASLELSIPANVGKQFEMIRKGSVASLLHSGGDVSSRELQTSVLSILEPIVVARMTRLLNKQKLSLEPHRTFNQVEGYALLHFAVPLDVQEQLPKDQFTVSLQLARPLPARGMSFPFSMSMLEKQLVHGGRFDNKTSLLVPHVWYEVPLFSTLQGGAPKVPRKAPWCTYRLMNHDPELRSTVRTDNKKTCAMIGDALKQWSLLDVKKAAKRIR